MTTLLLAFVLTAQAADAPGGISGRVLIRGENTPVQDARVTAVRIRHTPLPPSPNTPFSPPPQTVTGADGSYRFDRIEPGEYGINVQKTGFAVGLGTPTHPNVVVIAGQIVQAPDVFVDRAGAIAGRILDGNGEPLPDARVVALTERPLQSMPAVSSSNGPMRLIPAGQSARTDDLGEFRIYGLLPGEYAVAASLQRSPFQTETTASPTTLATTYYPGVIVEGSAGRVAVNAGQTTSGIEIRMATTAAFLVSGIVVAADGQPVQGAMVSLARPIGADAPYSSRTDARGQFKIGSVPPGAYRVGVSSSSNAQRLRLPAPLTVTITDGNVGGLRLVVQPF